MSAKNYPVTMYVYRRWPFLPFQRLIGWGEYPSLDAAMQARPWLFRTSYEIRAADGTLLVKGGHR